MCEACGRSLIIDLSPPLKASIAPAGRDGSSARHSASLQMQVGRVELRSGH